ncbi:B3 domain-containing protein [Melia azedarach]|uniref:B3 domain-containing protein n=1 Tax=Melia azedarach TaxID=155640 RepID=A0ACC1YMS3_MELAZ|nr:B3 domain-containing protein [Melia azedarach]
MFICNSTIKERHEELEMAEEREDHLSPLSLKDFEERGFKIDPNWSGLEALVAVACLASEKLEEETKGKEREAVESNGHWRRLAACNGLECGSSSRSCDDSRAWQLPRFSVRSEKPDRNLVLDKYSRKGKQFVVDLSKPGSSLEWNDNRSSCFSCLARVSDGTEREKAPINPVINSVPEKKQGFKVATRDKLLDDAMKARIPAWDDDEEWRAAYTKKKSKRSVTRRDSSEEKDSKPKKKAKRERYVVSTLTPDLPQQFREKIENVNGSKINLVTQKYLYASDVSDHQNRLLIPWKQIISMEKFLSEDERIFFDNNKNSKLVKFMEPSLQESVMTLKKWKMDKDNGNPSLFYVLQKQWKDFKNRNKLEVGDIIQLWSFRRPGDELCLAVVLVGRGGKLDEENNQNNNNGDVEGGGSSEATGNGSNEEGMGSTTGEASNSTP